MTDRQKRGAAFWASVVVTVVVLYVVSLGPAYWLHRQDWAYGPTYDVFHAVYDPIIWMYQQGPTLVISLMKTSLASVISTFPRPRLVRRVCRLIWSSIASVGRVPNKFMAVKSSNILIFSSPIPFRSHFGATGSI